MEKEVRNWTQITLLHFPRSEKDEPAIATNSENGPHLMKLYAQSLPAINRPRYHSEHLLEAQEPLESVPFSKTLIGRLPIEIREIIYIFALRISPVPDELIHDHRYGLFRWDGQLLEHGERKLKRPLPEWAKDHRRVTKAYAQRHWPHGYDHFSPYRPVLMATYPPRRQPSARSRLSLLLTCRQIYNEAWNLYYSANHFHLTSSSSILHFANKLTPARLQAITSLAMHTEDRIRPDVDLQNAMCCLASEFPNLRELSLEVYWEDARHLLLLKQVRGLRSVDISFTPCEPEEEVLQELEALTAKLLKPRQSPK